MDQDKKPSEQPENKAKDKAGIGQTDEEKGILPSEARKKKREELEKSGEVTKRPNFNGDADNEDPGEKPLQFKQ